jgi:hypothetical protein
VKVALIIALVACGRGNDPGGGGSAPRPAQIDDASEDGKPMSLTQRWRSHAIDQVGLVFDIVDGIEVREGETDSFRYAQQDGPVTVAMWSGKDITLAWWRGRFGGRRAKIDPETTITVCGRPGLRQEVFVEDDRATGAFRGSDDAIGHLEHRVPARAHIAIAGTTSTNTPFVVTWVVPVDRREALRADEAHFLASIRCL